MNKRDFPSCKPVALIAGPTASGKSGLAMALAREIGGTIINADASQLYRDLSVITARPTPDDEAQIPHRLYGIVDGANACSAAAWATLAKAELNRAWQAGSIPILTGGSGLYLQTLLMGIADVPEIDPRIREEVRKLPTSESYTFLAEEDPAAASRLNANDTTRIARALEVVRSTGKPLSEWQKHRQGGIATDISLAGLVMLPPREWIFDRLQIRLNWMFANGAVQEVRALMARALAPSLPVMKAIGVPEIRSLLSEEAGEEETKDRILLASRQYAKRQLTWSKNQSPPEWHRASETLDDQISRNLVIKLRDKLLTR